MEGGIEEAGLARETQSGCKSSRHATRVPRFLKPYITEIYSTHLDLQLNITKSPMAATTGLRVFPFETGLGHGGAFNLFRATLHTSPRAVTMRL